MEAKTMFVNFNENEMQENVSKIVDNDEGFSFVLREGSREFLTTELQITKAILEQRIVDMQNQKVQIEVLKCKLSKILAVLTAKEGKDSDDGNNIQR